MGFPEFDIPRTHSDPYDLQVTLEGVLPQEMSRSAVVNNLHVSEMYAKLEHLQHIRRAAEHIFTHILKETTIANERIKTLHKRIHDLEEESIEVKKMMEQHSPDCFTSVTSSQIVVTVQNVTGGLFNRGAAQEHVNRRRCRGQKVIPLNKFNRFWPCLEIDQKPATPDWVCLHSYTNPRLFFDAWAAEQRDWQERKARARSHVMRHFKKRRANEIKDASSSMLFPLQRMYKDDLGDNIVKVIGEERELQGYDSVELRFQRDKTKTEIVYGCGIQIDSHHDDHDIDDITPYELRKPGSIETIGQGSDPHLKRISEMKVPNIPRPVDDNLPPRYSEGIFEQQALPRGQDDDVLVERQRNKSMQNMMDAIRKGSTVDSLRPQLPLRQHSSNADPSQQSDYIFSGMKERQNALGEEEASSDLPRIARGVETPPPPTYSPMEHQSPDVLGEIRLRAAKPGSFIDYVERERGNSRLVGLKKWEPGCKEEDEFFKNGSHPLPPVPQPRNLRAPSETFGEPSPSPVR